MAIRLITGRNNKGVNTCKNNKFTDSTPCGIHTNDTCHHVWQRAQTATLHYITLHYWSQSDTHLTSGVVGVARVRCSFKSAVHEWRWPTQAQLMRSDILRNIDVLGKECLWSLVPLSPRGR